MTLEIYTSEMKITNGYKVILVRFMADTTVSDIVLLNYSSDRNIFFSSCSANNNHFLHTPPR